MTASNPCGIPLNPDCDLCGENKAALQREDGYRVCGRCQDIQPIPLASDDDAATCADCNADLAAGHQSSDNLNLCQDCADYRQQGEEQGDDFEDHVDGGRYDLSDDAEALASAGMGTDEDYGYYGDE